MRVAMFVFSSLVVMAQPALAGGAAANPTRPTFSDNAHPMAKGHLELELGGAFWENDQIATPFLLKIGLAEMAEFKVGGDGLRFNGAGDSNHVGFGNLGLYTKFRFLEQRGMRPAMGVLASVLLPTAGDDVGGGTTDLSLLLLLSGKFGPMGWDLNTGIDVRALDQDDVLIDIPAILAMSANIVGPLGVIFEVADYIPLSDQKNQLYLLGALTWTFHPRLILDVAFVGGPIDDEPTPDWMVLVGFTSTLVRLW